MINYPKISIVTPTYNGAKYLEETIRSILDQNYPNLEYIIIDGGSTDGSVDIIKKYQDRLAYWISEKDEGMYDALNKGFAKTNGEIMGWLNSDDMLHQKSLFTIADLFSIDGVEWMSGLPTWYDQNGRTIGVADSIRRSKYSYLKKGYHDACFPYIQQESTYWKRSLWEKSGGFISTKYKYASDSELWMRFYQNASLYSTYALIGGFRSTGDKQLSTIYVKEYLAEMDRIIDEYPLKDSEKAALKYLDKKWQDKIPVLRKRRFFKKTKLAEYSRPIEWDFKLNKFTVR